MRFSVSCVRAINRKSEKRKKREPMFLSETGFPFFLLLFMNPILALFGANAETYEFAKGYTIYIAYGAPFIIWSAAASFIVRAEGPAARL